MWTLQVSEERFPLRTPFTISRGRKHEAHVVKVRLSDGNCCGWGECVPYARYGETVDAVVACLTALARKPASSPDDWLQRLPPGAARNALDAAYWDARAKRTNAPVWRLAGLPEPKPVVTAYTLSLDTPEGMAAAALKARDHPLLKIKLGTEDDRERIAAVRRAAPHARLIVDANEGWSADNLARHVEACERAGVELIEQPLPAGRDEALSGIASSCVFCADESAQGIEPLAELHGRYQAVNIKLDKTGGLSPAIDLVREARSAGFEIFLGCMVGTSLAMAPALLLAAFARWVDLDGPLLLAADRPHAIHYDPAGRVHPPTPELWG